VSRVLVSAPVRAAARRRRRTGDPRSRGEWAGVPALAVSAASPSANPVGVRQRRRDMKTLMESPMSVYMTGVAIGMGCAFVAILILIGVLSV